MCNLKTVCGISLTPVQYGLFNSLSHPVKKCLEYDVCILEREVKPPKKGVVQSLTRNFV